MCLPSDALLQHLPSYLGFSYFGRGVALHSCSSKAQPLLLTLDQGYLLTATPPDLEHGIAPLGPSVPMQPPLLGHGVADGDCSHEIKRCLLLGSQEKPEVTGKFGLGIWNEAEQRLIEFCQEECTGYSKHPLPTTHGHLHMDIIRLSTLKSD